MGKGRRPDGPQLRTCAARIPAGDIADRATSERAISEGVARFGRIDTLVNNAGIFIAKPFTQYTGADYTAMLGVNLAGFFHITQRAITEMEKQGSGHIVQITTSLVDHANSAVPSVLASLTKGGLDAVTRSLAIEYARSGIRVNAVAPGVIDTDMSNFAKTEAGRDATLNMQALKRIGKPEDVADVIVFLASDNARWITGAVIPVDGGSKL